MSLRKCLALVIAVFSLQGCLQVELTGPLTDATITIRPLRGGAAVVNGLTTANELEVRAQVPASDWNSFSELTRLKLLGGVQLPKGQIEPNTWYLVEATGGFDQDWDEDGLIDLNPRAVNGSLHAIVRGSNLRKGLTRVNLLTEAVYRHMQYRFPLMTDAELMAELNFQAARLVSDVNRDGKTNYNDVLAWSRLQHADAYNGPPDFLWELEVAVADNIEADLLDLITDRMIVGASWDLARPSSGNIDNLMACLLPVWIYELCEFEQLPLIGQETDEPDIEDIMRHLVVEDAWMARRFETLLRRMPAELRLLFRSVTAIVIGNQIRPSYYSSGTGAIYLDANTFWLYPGERRGISQEPDYRAAFEQLVAFTDLWRYVSTTPGNGVPNFDPDRRTLEEIEAPAAALLFHELAHATDVLPVSILPVLNPRDTPYFVETRQVSEHLQSVYPLTSSELQEVAQVLYQGAPTTPVVTRHTASDIGFFFEQDLATDLYAYSTRLEDLAMVFEEFMMARHYGLIRDVAFASWPAGNEDDWVCDDFRVRWGVRGRVGEPAIVDRLELVLDELLPELNFSAELAALPRPTPMVVGSGWCDGFLAAGNRAATKPPQRAPRHR